MNKIIKRTIATGMFLLSIFAFTNNTTKNNVSALTSKSQVSINEYNTVVTSYNGITQEHGTDHSNSSSSGMSIGFDPDNQYFDSNHFQKINVINSMLRQNIDDVSDYFKEKEVEELSQIPLKLLQDKSKQNYGILVTDTDVNHLVEKIDNEKFEESIAAVFIPTHKLIIIGSHKLPYASALHEFAHTIDFTEEKGVGVYSETKEFKDIFEKEKNNLFKGDSKSNIYYREHIEEYFAQTVALYYKSVEDNQMLKELAPLTYDFISKVIKEQMEK